MSSTVKNNRAILAAAGSRKTQEVVESALAASGNVLITTYTNENQRIIRDRITQIAGAIPSNISIMGWFSFLISQCAKPYQREMTGEPFVIRGLNFIGERPRSARKTELRYFMDKRNGLYRNAVSDFVCELNSRTGGAVISRIQKVFNHIFVDEVQDLVAFDLDVLDLLMACETGVTLVGDPRQHTYSTNRSMRNHKYQGQGFVDWLNERDSICALETRNCSYRCNQAICDFADSIYPDLPATKSLDVEATGHDGIFEIYTSEALEYWSKYRPVVLRYNKTADTLGLGAMNIGKAKGGTFDRVLIFTTKPMREFLQKRDSTMLKAPESLYVAVTRARFSVAFAVPDPKPTARSRRSS
jgi:DNA helicase-2/ATP-dependent DNA helicase PcrA